MNTTTRITPCRYCWEGHSADVGGYYDQKACEARHWRGELRKVEEAISLLRRVQGEIVEDQDRGSVWRDVEASLYRLRRRQRRLRYSLDLASYVGD